MMVVTLKMEESKREIMRRKKELREKKKIIEDDRTREERRMMLKLEKIVEKESREGNRVIVRYGKICVEGKWWCMRDEEKDRLRD